MHEVLKKLGNWICKECKTMWQKLNLILNSGSQKLSNRGRTYVYLVSRAFQLKWVKIIDRKEMLINRA